MVWKKSGKSLEFCSQKSVRTLNMYSEFFWSVSLLLSKTKTSVFLKKCAVKAAKLKSDILSSCRVEIHLERVRSLRCSLQN